MNLTIKRIPADVAATLKGRAAARGRSLNAELLRILASVARETERRQSMPGREGLDRLVSGLPRTDVVAILREERDRH